MPNIKGKDGKFYRGDSLPGQTLRSPQLDDSYLKQNNFSFDNSYSPDAQKHNMSLEALQGKQNFQMKASSSFYD